MTKMLLFEVGAQGFLYMLLRQKQSVFCSLWHVTKMHLSAQKRMIPSLRSRQSMRRSF